jgi:hypothetical protein
MSTNRYVTKAEAAALCGKSPETIQRRRKSGDLPNHRYAEDGSATSASPGSPVRASR